MKKIAILLLLVLPCVFMSCSSDDDDKMDSIVGTKWVLNDDDGHVLTTLSFFTAAKVEVSYDSGMDIDTVSYTYSSPKVTIIGIYEDGAPTTLTGTVSGNTMSFPQTIGGVTVSVPFIKQ